MYKYSLRMVDPGLSGESESEKDLFCDSILTEKQIKELVVAKIGQKYPLNGEMKMQRLGILDSQNGEFMAYNKYAEDCRAYGDELLEQSLADKKAWADYQYESAETRTEFIKRLEKAGLL